MAGKSYTFRGTGDFSDFNSKAKQAASTMGDSFKKAYDDMLENANKYSTSSKKQIDFLNSAFAKFKESSNSGVDNTFDSLFEEIKRTEKDSLSNLDVWKSKKSDREEMKRSYEEQTGKKYDPYSQDAQQFKTKYDSSVEKEYREQKRDIYGKSKSQSDELDSLKQSLEETLGSMNPKEYYQKIRDSAREQIIEAKNQNRNIGDVIRQLEESEKIEDKLLASQLREEVASERRVNRRDSIDEDGSKDNSSNSFLKDLSNFSYIDKMTNMGQGLAKSKNGSELFGELVDGVAAAGGGLSQLLMTGIGAGVGGPFGAALGGVASVVFGKAVEGTIKVVGEAVKRTMDERESLSTNMNNYRSLTGSTQSFRDLSYQGVDYKTFVDEQTILAKAKGSRVDNNTVETSLSLQKGYEIDKGTISSLLEIQRNSGNEISSTIGRILTHGEKDIFKGGDRTFLPEFTQKFITLQKDFLKNQTQVKDTTVLDIFSMFDKLGGQFSTKDYRSQNNIQNINSSLVNPQNDALKALSYKLVSDRNPNLDMFDVQLEMQKGLSSPEYFKDRLRFIKDNYKNDPALAKSEIAQQFGLGDNLQAAKSIYENMDDILSSNISSKEMSSKYGLGDYKSEATKSTTMMEQQQAQITNEFVKSAVDGMKMAGEALVNTVKMAFAGATFTVKNGEVNFSRNPIITNEIKTPSNPNKKYLGLTGLSYGTQDSTFGSDWIPGNDK